MSTYQYGDMTVKGNAEILRDFVEYLENEYDDEFVREGIKRGQTRDGNIEHEYIDDNCFSVWGDDNYFFIDIEGLSEKFSTLKFEYIQECHDGQSSSDYRVCLNGKSVAYASGNSFAFGSFDESAEKCRLCNSSLEWDSELCDECSEFLEVLDN